MKKPIAKNPSPSAIRVGGKSSKNSSSGANTKQADHADRDAFAVEDLEARGTGVEGLLHEPPTKQDRQAQNVGCDDKVPWATRFGHSERRDVQDGQHHDCCVQDRRERSVAQQPVEQEDQRNDDAVVVDRQAEKGRIVLKAEHVEVA